MSGQGFHVHGTHDKALEHAAHGDHHEEADAHKGVGGGSFTKQIALFTAIIATVLQIAIALAAIALLTKRKWLEWGVFAAGAAGVVVGVLACCTFDLKCYIFNSYKPNKLKRESLF